MQAIPRLLRLALFVLAADLLILLLFRAGFWLWFRDPADPIPTTDLLQAFYLGTKFDLRLVLLSLLPLILLGSWRVLSPFERVFNRRFWLAYLSFAATLMVSVFGIHFGYYSYLQKPLDATLLRFTANAAISARMVWQTYPVIPILIALLAFMLLYGWWLQRYLQRLSAATQTPLPRLKKAALVTFTGFLVLLGLYGQFSWYPLRWSNAFFSTHHFAGAVTVNPLLHFFDTLKNRKVTYDLAATEKVYPDMVNYLGIEKPDVATLNFERIEKAVNKPHNPPINVVMVFLESYAAFKTGIYGNPLDPTPNFDRLARQGIYFENYYVPQPGTARSVFTAITGIPDPEIVRTASRNPLVVEQQTIINEFKGYEKFYFLGGSASWGNIRGLLSRNIPGLHIFEEGSYQSPRVDVWGIADHHLFQEAIQVLKDKTDKPFFSVIQTSGNHRPYTIPEDAKGFQRQQRETDQLHRFGFDSNEEYNSFRYMDYSIGVLIEEARKAPWFDNTLFVFFGDHGLPGHGEHMKKADVQLSLNSLRVPLLFYAPALLGTPRHEVKVASELDLLPTIAGRALPSFRNTTLGRDLFDTRFDNQRYAFTILNSSNSDLGLVSSKFYLKSKADGSQTRLHLLDSANPRTDVSQEFPQEAEAMRHLCHAIYETARYMLYNNGKYRQE